MKETLKGRLITEKLNKTKSPEKERKALKWTGKKTFLPVFLFSVIILCSNAFPDDLLSPITTTDVNSQTPTITLTQILSNTLTATPTNTPQFIIAVTSDKSGTVALGDTIHYTILYSLIGSLYTPNAYLNISTVNNVANKSGYLVGIPSPRPLAISNVQQPAIAWNVGPPDSLVSNIYGQLDFYYTITSTANPTYRFYAYWNDGMTLGGAYSESLVIITKTVTATCTFTLTQTQTYTTTLTLIDMPSETLSPTWTQTPSFTESSTLTTTDTLTPTFTPTYTYSPENTQTATMTATETSTQTYSETTTDMPTLTQTFTPTNTTTNTATWTQTYTETITITQTQMPTWTPTFTFTSTANYTKTYTQTYSVTITSTYSISFTCTASASPTVTIVLTPTVTPVSTQAQDLCLKVSIKSKEKELNPYIILTNCSNADIDLNRITLRIYYTDKYYNLVFDKTYGLMNAMIPKDNNCNEKEKYGNEIKYCEKVNLTEKNDICNNRIIEITFNKCAGTIKKGDEIELKMLKEAKDKDKCGDNFSKECFNKPDLQLMIAAFIDGNIVIGEVPVCITPVIKATPVKAWKFDFDLIKKTTPDSAMQEPDEKNVYNYPNPCNSVTILRFPLPESENVTIAISDVKGNLVWKKELGSFETNTGINYIKWLCVNNSGREVSNGVYICKVVFKNMIITKKIAVRR